jgi:hypothetical protein
MDGGRVKRRSTPSPPTGRKAVTVTPKEYEVVVRLSFPVAPAKAKEVLERWWAFKAHRKSYMRDRRAGRAPVVGKGST